MAELRFDDLDDVCPTCDTEGVVWNPRWRDWYQTHDELPPEGHALELEPEEVPCQTCAGVGYLLTDAGRGLLSFLLRHRP